MSDHTSPDDPFADLVPPPEDYELPARPAGAPQPPPVVPSEPVDAPTLPPPVGGPEETPWSVQADTKELDSLLAGGGSTVEEPAAAEPEPAPITPEPAPIAVEPSEAPILGGTADSTIAAAPLEIPPEFWGEQPVEEPPDEPIIDLSTRDTAGLLSNVGGPLLWVVGAGAAWYFLTRGADPIVSGRNWPTPSATWDVLLDLAEDETARTTARETVQRLVAALAVGGVVGLSFGSLTGRRRHVRNLLRPLTGVFRVLSPFLLLYLVFVWGGTGWWVGWAPAAVGVAALTAWSTDRALADSPRRVTTESGPQVMRGLRSALVLAWTLVFASEQALGLDGIFTALAGAGGDMAIVVAWLIVAAILAVVVDGLLRLVQHLLARG